MLEGLHPEGACAHGVPWDLLAIVRHHLRRIDPTTLVGKHLKETRGRGIQRDADPPVIGHFQAFHRWGRLSAGHGIDPCADTHHEILKEPIQQVHLAGRAQGREAVNDVLRLHLPTFAIDETRIIVETHPLPQREGVSGTSDIHLPFGGQRWLDGEVRGVEAHEPFEDLGTDAVCRQLGQAQREQPSHLGGLVDVEHPAVGLSTNAFARPDLDRALRAGRGKEAHQHYSQYPLCVHAHG